MATLVSYDSEKSALLVELPSQEDYDGLLKTTRALADQLQGHRCTKLYVDARQIELDISFLQAFHLVATATGAPDGLRVAVTARQAHRVMVEFAGSSGALLEREAAVVRVAG